MKYVYLLILCIVIAMVISFKNYKKEYFKSFSSKDAPLKILYGFSMLFVRKKLNEEELKSRLKSISLCISAFTVIIFFGLIFSLGITSSATNINQNEKSSLEISDKDSSLNSITEENNHDIETSTRENEKYNYVKETIALFEKYREDIETTFLGENESFFAITKPLNLITEYGDEGLSISWEFETNNVIDTDGSILYENINSDGCSTIAYANLSLNGANATLSIPIFISPP